LVVELIRLDEAGLELGERAREGVGKAGGAGRGAEAVQRGAGDDAADEEPALRVGRDRARVGAAAGELAEEVVEGADRAAEERTGAAQEVALDALDVRSPGTMSTGSASRASR